MVNLNSNDFRQEIPRKPHRASQLCEHRERWIRVDWRSPNCVSYSEPKDTEEKQYSLVRRRTFLRTNGHLDEEAATENV